MRIFFQNIHRRLPKSLAKAVAQDGSTVLLPDHSFKSIYSYGEFQTQQEIDNNPFMAGCYNIKSISYEELILDPPEIIFVGCYEVEKETILNIWNKIDKTKSKLIYYNGNNNFYCDWDLANNIVTTDLLCAQKAKLRNKNFIIWLPWIDYEEFSLKQFNNNNKLNSYISKYKECFPQDSLLAQQVSEHLKKEEIVFNNYESLEFNDVSKLMQDSFGTLHIKSLEGYGYSIIESIASGRMVFLFRPQSLNKTYTKWCLEDETCFYFDDFNELKTKIKKYKDNIELYQKNASNKIKTIIDNDRQNKKLNTFLKGL